MAHNAKNLAEWTKVSMRTLHIRHYILIGILFLVQPFALSAATDVEVPADEILIKQLTAIENYLTRIHPISTHARLSPNDLRDRIKAGSMWLREAQEDTGHFKYEYLPFSDEYTKDDNIVRQAGALYALAEILRRDPTGSYVDEESIVKGITFFREHTITDTYNGSTFQCVTDHKNGTTCALGTTSLVLVALLDYLEVRPEHTASYAHLAKSYAAYVMAMKKPNAGFQDQHRTRQSIQNSEESSYANGEAILALARYYAWQKDTDVKGVIDDAYTYLSKSAYDVPLYLWIMSALDEMYTLWPKDEYVTYAKNYTTWRLSTVRFFKESDQNYCAYTEGLASALGILKGNASSAEESVLRDELGFWNTKSSFLQLLPGDEYRVLIDNNGLHFGNLSAPEQALGGFLTSEHELTQRIDYTQHCLGTYVRTLFDVDGEIL